MESDPSVGYDSCNDSSYHSDPKFSDDSDGNNDDNLSVPHEPADPVVISQQSGKFTDEQEALLHPNVPEPKDEAQPELVDHNDDGSLPTNAGPEHP